MGVPNLEHSVVSQDTSPGIDRNGGAKFGAHCPLPGHFSWELEVLIAFSVPIQVINHPYLRYEVLDVRY